MAPYAGLWLNLDEDGYVTQGTLVLYEDDGGTRRSVKARMRPLSTLADALRMLGIVALDESTRVIITDDGP